MSLKGLASFAFCLCLIARAAEAGDVSLGVRAGYGSAFLQGENPYSLGFGLQLGSRHLAPFYFALETDVFSGSTVRAASASVSLVEHKNAATAALVAGYEVTALARADWQLVVRPEVKAGALVGYASADLSGATRARTHTWSILPMANPAFALLVRHGHLEAGAELVAGPLALWHTATWIGVSGFVFGAWTF